MTIGISMKPGGLLIHSRPGRLPGSAWPPQGVAIVYRSKHRPDKNTRCQDLTYQQIALRLDFPGCAAKYPAPGHENARVFIKNHRVTHPFENRAE
jgi:hypothetical protein